MVPWSRLPRVTKLAPEFYEPLQKAPGFMAALRSYLTHKGSGWVGSTLATTCGTTWMEQAGIFSRESGGLLESLVLTLADLCDTIRT
jgi:hypothetical protein